MGDKYIAKRLFLWYTFIIMTNKPSNNRYKRRSDFNKQDRITVVVERSLHAILMAYADERKLYLEEAVKQLLYKGLAQDEGWKITETKIKQP